MKVVYCGYDFFSNCLDVISGSGNEVSRIYTWKGDGKYNFSSDVIGFAEGRGIPVYFRKIKASDIGEIVAEGCKLLISAAYPYRIPEIPKGELVGLNIHPTLLPQGRGPWPLPLLITDYPECAGITIHKLTKEMDCGDIVTSSAITIDPAESYESLAVKCRMTAGRLLEDLLSGNNLQRMCQDALPQGQGSYWPMPTEDQQVIKWEWSVKKIDAFVRSYGKCECIAVINGEKYDVQDVTVFEAAHAHPQGSLVMKANGDIVVAAKDGFVCLRHYRRATS